MNHDRNNSIEINLESLSEYLRVRYPDRELVFDNIPAVLRDLLAGLHNRRIDTIDQLDVILQQTEDAAEDLERNEPRDIGVDSRYTAVGLVWLSLLLHNDSRS